MYIPGVGRGLPTRRPDQVGGNTPLPTAQKPNVAQPGGGFLSSFRSGVGNMVPQGMDHQALGLGLIQFGKNFADGTASGEYDFSPAFETFAKSSIANQNKRGPLESVKALYEDGKIPQSDYLAAQRDKSGAVAALILKRVYGRESTKDTRPTSQKEYEIARSQGFDGTFQQWVDRNKAPVMTPEQKRDFELDTHRKKAEIDQGIKTEAEKSEALRKKARVEQQYREFTSQINKVFNHENLSDAVGPVDSMFPTFSGKTKDFETQERNLRGKAFMEMREALKGAGQVTDYEGKRAEDALVALDSATDEASYRQALKDLQRSIDGMYKAYQIESGLMPPDAQYEQTLAEFQRENSVLAPSVLKDASDSDLNARRKAIEDAMRRQRGG